MSFLGGDINNTEIGPNYPTSEIVKIRGVPRMLRINGGMNWKDN